MEHEPTAKKHCPKKLDFKNAADTRERDFVDMNKIHHDHPYLCRQEQAIPEDSTVSTDVSLSPGTASRECQTDLTADEIEYLVTELEECRKKITILDGKVENKKRLKRELNTEDMLRDDESVKFYTAYQWYLPRQPQLPPHVQHNYHVISILQVVLQLLLLLLRFVEVTEAELLMAHAPLNNK